MDLGELCDTIGRGDRTVDDVAGELFDATETELDERVRTLELLRRRVEAEMAELVDRVIEDDFPFLGACYGIGLVGSHLGGIVDKTFGEPIGQVRVDITPAGSADPLFAGLETPFEAFVGHKEACSRLPDGAVLLASSTGCPVQAFRLGRNVYATQFHPELDVPGIVTRIHAYRDFGYFDPETMDALIEHVSAASVVHPSRIVAAFVGRYASAS